MGAIEHQQRQDSDASAYVTVADGARILTVSTKTIRRKIADGSLPAYRLGDQIIRVRREDLASLLRRIPTAGSAASTGAPAAWNVDRARGGRL